MDADFSKFCNQFRYVTQHNIYLNNYINTNYNVGFKWTKKEF